MKTTISLLALVVILAACSAPPVAPKDSVFVEGPGVDSVRLYFDTYVAGDWATMRSFFQDTAAIYHNGSGKLTADSIISYHTSRRQLYDKVEANIMHAQVTKYENGDTWRNLWGELTVTMKGSGEVLTVPIHMAWQMAGGKVGMEMAYYDRLIIFQSMMRANEAAAATKK